MNVSRAGSLQLSIVDSHSEQNARFVGFFRTEGTTCIPNFRNMEFLTVFHKKTHFNGQTRRRKDNAILFHHSNFDSINIFSSHINNHYKKFKIRHQKKIN